MKIINTPKDILYKMNISLTLENNYHFPTTPLLWLEEKTKNDPEYISKHVGSTRYNNTASKYEYELSEIKDEVEKRQYITREIWFELNRGSSNEVTNLTYKMILRELLNKYYKEKNKAVQKYNFVEDNIKILDLENKFKKQILETIGFDISILEFDIFRNFVYIKFNIFKQYINYSLKDQSECKEKLSDDVINTKMTLYIKEVLIDWDKFMSHIQTKRKI